MRLIAEETIGFERGSPVVCIPVAAVDARTLASLRSIMEHTDPQSPVIVVASSTLLGRIADGLQDQTRTILGLPWEPATQVGAINAAIRTSLPSDVVLVIPGIRVTAGWLERLGAAAVSDSTVASATPLCLGSGGVALLGGDRYAGAGRSVQSDPDSTSTQRTPGLPRSREMSPDLDQVARRVAERSSRVRPRIAMVGPGCAYIRRSALELARPLEEALCLGDALADLAVRLMAVGMVNVLADDVLVGGDSDWQPAEESSASSAQIGEVIRETLVNDDHGSVPRAMMLARTALRRLSVTIDGRSLTPTAGGTQTYVIELILALAHERDVAVRVLVPPDLSERASRALAGGPEVELLTYEQAIDEPRPTDVVHRPQQVFTPDDLALLRQVGERVVVGQQDLIAYHNQSYHEDLNSWRAYRRITRLALAGADQAIFFSEHARRDALAEDLLAEGRAHVVGVGIDTLEPAAGASRPEGVEADQTFLLCLGADYAHKNRPFALELLGALRERGWSGRLVLAGSHVPYGSSREREQELLRANPHLAELTVELGPVDEPGRRWLYANACAVVYPTLYEGFGLLPLEAARADLPCLFASQASLSELAAGAATLIPWDARASASAVLPLLSAGPARERHLAQLRTLQIPDWSEVARRLLAVYERALRAPRSEAAPRVWQELTRESHIVWLDREASRLAKSAQEYQDAYHSLEARVHTGLPLIDDDGLLSHDQQRGLMRVAARGRLGALALKPFGLLGRLGGQRRG